MKLNYIINYQAGSTLFAQLEIWKASRCCGSETPREMQPASNQPSEMSPWNVSNVSLDCNGIDDPTGTGE